MQPGRWNYGPRSLFSDVDESRQNRAMQRNPVTPPEPEDLPWLSLGSGASGSTKNRFQGGDVFPDTSLVRRTPFPGSCCPDSRCCRKDAANSVSTKQQSTGLCPPPFGRGVKLLWPLLSCFPVVRTVHGIGKAGAGLFSSAFHSTGCRRS